MWKFLDKIGLGYLLELLKNIFASNKEVEQVVEETNLYVLEIDYDKELKFDTTLIISSVEGPSPSSPIIGTGLINQLIIAK